MTIDYWLIGRQILGVIGVAGFINLVSWPLYRRIRRLEEREDWEKVDRLYQCYRELSIASEDYREALEIHREMMHGYMRLTHSARATLRHLEEKLKKIEEQSRYRVC
jgi:hypothetical protein